MTASLSAETASPPRASWLTFAKARFFRSAGNIAFWLHRRSNPPARLPSRTIWLDSILARKRDRGQRKIRVDIYEPATSTASSTSARPAVLNFHGGGFVLGSSTDDSPWCTRVADELGAVVFSVDYRLGPDVVFPTNIEDCVDAVLQICSQAEHYGIDPRRIAMSGFSAGGTQALATWIILAAPQRFGYTFAAPPLDVSALALFYPLLDWTVPRDEKRAQSLDPKRTLPPYLTELFQAAYVSFLSDKGDIRASPGHVPDDILVNLPPTHLVICEYDMLRREAEQLRDRAVALGRAVTSRLVRDEEHGFDKPFPLKQKALVAEEYAAAIDTLRRRFPV